MNTLNNQQINPGNRVDFSRIRRFAKGGVPKFKTPAGTLSNTSNNSEDFWTNFNNDVITHWGQIAGDQNFNINDINTFLQQNRNLARTTGYDGTRAIYGQGVKQYQQDFHNKYGFGNTDSFWSGMNASNNALNTGDTRQASGQQFTGDDYFGTQTDYRRANYFSADELARANEAIKNRGWQFVLDDAQNEGHTVGSDGRQFYKLQEIPQTAVTTTTSTTPTTVTNTTTEESSITPNEYQSAEYLPEYRKGIWTDGLHLAGIYGNNMIGAQRDYNLEMKKSVPLHQASQQNAIVTDGYTERMLNKQALAEARARNAAAASNTSNADAARQMQLDFESQVGMQSEMQNNAVQAREYKTSLQNAQQVADQNTANRTAVANQNRANLIAQHNAMIDARRKLNATKTAETAGLIQNLDASLNKFNLQEKMNKQYYNQAINDYMFNKDKSAAYNEYSDILENGHLRAGYEGLMGHLLSGGDASITTEDLASLQDNQGDFTKTKAILEKYAPNNPEIAAFLSEVEGLQSQAETNYYKRVQDLASKKSYANLFQKQYLGSYPGFERDFLNTNWTTLFPSYKKGGKVEDRFIKYVEHTRKVLKDQDDRNKHAQTQAQKKLLRDLDALDRETLLLLRSIFK